MRWPQAEVEEIPERLLAAALRRHAEDPSARITGFRASRVQDPDGFSLSSFFGSDLHVVSVTWAGRIGVGSADWVIKRWYRGRLPSLYYGVEQCGEAVGFLTGLIPAGDDRFGIDVPYIHAACEPDGGAWVVMRNVRREMESYRAMRGDPVLVLPHDRARTARIAHFQAWWSRPEQRAVLERQNWLSSGRFLLLVTADLYRRALRREPLWPWQVPVEVEENMRETTEAFQDCLPAGHRSLWVKHLCDRDGLVALQDGIRIPDTLVHGDLTYKNLGVGDAPAFPTVIIDWEFMARGPVDCALADADARESMTAYLGHGGIPFDPAESVRLRHIREVAADLAWAFIMGWYVATGAKTPAQAAEEWEPATERLRRLLALGAR